ncbi:MAG: Crp/Fnr family transcriptional regulator [Patescibacteria group bacterium]|nr:Crp/Fnr family transcriptional regulator [Patescibacteria group bacterium]
MTLIIFRPGSIFPLRWGLLHAQNKHFLQAMTDVQVLRTSREEFNNFLENNPDVLINLTRRILVRAGGLMERMEYLVFGNAYQKVASILYILAKRFGRREGEEVRIKVPMTHREIAFLIGVARETVSLEIGKLVKSGIISDKNKIIIVKNIKKLIKESLLS